MVEWLVSLTYRFDSFNRLDRKTPMCRIELPGMIVTAVIDKDGEQVKIHQVLSKSWNNCTEQIPRCIYSCSYVCTSCTLCRLSSHATVYNQVPRPRAPDEIGTSETRQRNTTAKHATGAFTHCLRDDARNSPTQHLQRQQ